MNILVLHARHIAWCLGKKSEAFLIFVRQGPLLYRFSKLLYKSDLHKKIESAGSHILKNEVFFLAYNEMLHLFMGLSP